MPASRSSSMLVPALAILLAACQGAAAPTAAPVGEATSPTAGGPPVAPAVSTAAAGADPSGHVVPTAGEIARRLGDAMAKPPKMRMVNQTKVDTVASILGRSATNATTVTSEQWSDGTGRTRAESTLTMDVHVGGGDATPIMPPGAGTREAKTVTVSDGETLWVSMGGPMNVWFETDLTELVRQNGAAPDMNAQWVGTLLKDMLGKYSITYQGNETVAGRAAYTLAAVPKAPDAKARLSMMMTIDRLDLAVDAETWQVLRMNIDGGTDFGAALAAARGRAGGGAPATRAAGNATSTGSLHVEMRATEVDYTPVLSEDLFTFVPPPGARKMDFPSRGGSFRPPRGGP